jgi:hypothetical protein
VTIPIACSLTQPAARAQLDEWQELLDAAVVRRHRISGGRLELELDPTFRGLDDLVQLARREAACCTFFDFSLTIGAELLTFVIEVPPEAEGVLDQFG